MTPSWMQGYTSDIEYTSGYYRDQEPKLLNLSAIMHGIEPIDIDKSFTYCELGCGMGHTSLIMAANYPQGKFIAIDYNPAQISQAKKLAEQAGLENIEFLELSFEEIASDSSLLPSCDFITFHGIYAWVSDDNRQYLADICKKHLKSGGLVYNSYNAQPGWAAVAPLQKTLNLLSQQYSGNSLERFNSAVGFINNFRELKPRYFEHNSTVLKPRLNNIKEANPTYLVHEYLNEGWEALYFSDVASKMSEAKLDFLGLASPAEAYSESIMPAKLKEQLAELNDVSAREMVKDLAYNTSFRKDVYSRGGRRLDAKRQVELLNEINWILTSSEVQKEYKFNLSVGEATGSKSTYDKVVKALAKKSMTTEELQKETELPLSNMIQTLIFLYSFSRIAIKNTNEEPKNIGKLNRVLASENTQQRQGLAVAAGNISTAMLLNPIELTFLNSHFEMDGKEIKEGESVIDTMFNELSSKGLNLTISGKAYEGDEMKDKLKEMAKNWVEETLPRLKEMGCI